MGNETTHVEDFAAPDDDPTAELELPRFRVESEAREPREADDNTYDFTEELNTGVSVSQLRSDLQSRTEMVGRLQFDLEQLKAKWSGLEKEIEAREAQTEQLGAEIDHMRSEAVRKDEQIGLRDDEIRNLKGELRQQNDRYAALSEKFETLQSNVNSAEEQARRTRQNIDPGFAALSLEDFAERLERSETYADALRQQLQDLMEANSREAGDHQRRKHELRKLQDENADLVCKIDEAERVIGKTQAEIEAMTARHEEELRTLRFELSDAQTTIVEQAQLNGELTSSLVSTRGSKDELEKAFEQAKEDSVLQMEELRRQIRELEQGTSSLEQKLSTKSEAIGVLLAELAKKTEQLESISNIEELVHDIDDRISERMDTSPPPSTGTKRPSPDRLTRLLVGTIDGQLLRFPLFKDQLTIGRTEHNDIQLKAAYISRRHAVIQTDRNGTRIIDWGSTNGVYVNTRRVKEQFLSHGDIVTIGDARFRYEERPKRDA